MSLFIFGDSFIEPIVKTLNYREDYILKYFFGKTMKGLSKNTNISRKEIEDIIKKNISSKTKCIIFAFGYVDVITSYYYTKYISKKKYNIHIIIKNYVNFIKNIKLSNPNTKKIIINFFSPSISNQYLFILKILTNANIKIDDFEKLSDKEIKNNFTIDFIINKYIKDSEYLHNQCILHNIEYLSFYEDMTNDDHKLKKEYIPNILINHHYKWDTFLQLFVQKINECGCDLKLTEKNKNEVIKLYELYKKYFKIYHFDKNYYKNSINYYKKILTRIIKRWNKIHS